MQQREVRVYLLDALAASEQIVSIRDEVGAKRLREDRIVRAAVERNLIIDALVRDLRARAH